MASPKTRSWDDSIKDILGPLSAANKDEENGITIDNDVIELINSSKEAVDIIKKFHMNGGSFYYKKDEYSRYEPKDNRIVIGGSPTAKTIFHELAHAVGINRIDPNAHYDTATDFSEAHMQTEGEAHYYERKIVEILKVESQQIIKNLSKKKDEIDKYDQEATKKRNALNKRIQNIANFLNVANHITVWEDDKLEANDSEEENKKINAIVYKININADDKIKKEGFNKIAEINRIMVPGNQGIYEDGEISDDQKKEEQGIALTYDESKKYEYFKTILKHDYIDLLGKPKSNVKNIYIKKLYIKSLVNAAHNTGENKFLGDQNSKDRNDHLKNSYHEGTPLSKSKNDYDFLYGGVGNDVITGSNYKEIILGGLHDDIIRGNGGADIIGGNKGNDHLHAAENEKGTYKSAEGEELSDTDKNILVAVKAMITCTVAEEKMIFSEMKDHKMERSLKQEAINPQAMITCRVMQVMTICMAAKAMTSMLLKIKILFMMPMGMVKYGLLKNLVKIYIKRKSMVIKPRNLSLMKIIKIKKYG